MAMTQKEFMSRMSLNFGKHTVIAKADGTVSYQTAGQGQADVVIDAGNPNVAFSRQTQGDAYKEKYERGAAIKPPYDLDWLTQLKEESDALQENTEAMVQNVVGMGFTFNYEGKDQAKRRPGKAIAEEDTLKDWFAEPNPDASWLEVSKNSWTDKEDLGNLAQEYIRDNKGEIVFCYHHPFKDMRLVPLTAEDYYIEDVPMRRHGQITKIPALKTYRRFVRYIKDTNQFRFYKSFGDPRPMLVNGARLKPTDRKPRNSQLASEILWYAHYIGAGSPYGLPRWIGSTFDVAGRRNAQALNWDLLRSQGLPPMAIVINGQIDENTWDQIWNMVMASKGLENFNKLWVLQVKGTPTQIGGKAGGADIRIEDLSGMQKTDSMFRNYLTDTEDRIRQNFRNPPCMIGATGSYCISEDSQVLTENGWKYHFDIAHDEKIATIHPQTFALEYHVPKEKFVYLKSEDNKMIHFKTTRGIDALVTPNHDMFSEYLHNPGWYKSKAEEFLTATNDNQLMVAAPNYFGGSRPFASLTLSDGKSISFDTLLPFISCLATDGHVATDPSIDTKFCCTKMRKRRLFRKITKAIAADMGVKPTLGLRSPSSRYFVYGIYNKAFNLWCRENIGTHCRDKRLPSWITHLPKTDLQTVFDCLMATDGSWTTKDSGEFSSTSPVLADQFQIIAISLGWRARMRVKSYSSENGRRDCYRVMVCNTSTHTFRRKHVTEQEYYGKVFCFSVKNHLIITRRNGCVLVSGNSYATLAASKTIGEEQVYGPERIIWDMFINRNVVRGNKGFGCEYWTYKTKGAQVASTSDLMQAVTALNQAGALTYNNAVEIANDALGRSFSKFDQKWGDLPVSIVQAIVNRENIIGTEDIISKQQQANENTPPQQQDFIHPAIQAQQQAQSKKVVSIAERLKKSDIISMERDLKGLYQMIEDIHGQLSQIHARR